MDRKIGEVFNFRGRKLRVEVESGDKFNDCDRCYFRNKPCNTADIQNVRGSCRKEFRNDQRGVVFVEIEENEEQDVQNDVRSYNVGNSDYSKHTIQPWDMWIEYHMNPFDADIQKRLIRKKTEPGMTRLESRKLDYKKIIHICQERIRQLEQGYDPFENIEEK